MRRLNLLQQIMYGQTILSLRGAAAATRHLWTTINLINSRRGWRDLLACSGRELLTAAGYKAASRYSTTLLKTFQSEARAAGLIDFETKATTTIYYIAAVTRGMVETAKASAEPKTDDAVVLAPRLAAKIAEEAKKGDSDAVVGTGNGSKVVKIRKADRGNEFGGNRGESGGDGGDALISELERLGL